MRLFHFNSKIWFSHKIYVWRHWFVSRCLSQTKWKAQFKELLIFCICWQEKKSWNFFKQKINAILSYIASWYNDAAEVKKGCSISQLFSTKSNRAGKVVRNLWSRITRSGITKATDNRWWIKKKWWLFQKARIPR